MRHFIEPNSFSLEEQLALLDLADRMEADPAPYAHLCDGRILATLFYEPSTRTRLSFESAMLRLGGKTLGFAGAQLSSASKGETVEDTARVVSNYADVIAMRHPKEGAPLRASLSARVPVINAGDGGHAHPSQTMIDLMTIRQRKGRLDHLTIGFCGDLKFGRTVHSLTAALSQFEGNRFVFISPEDLRLPQYVKNESLEPTHQIYKETADLEAELPHLDVLYMTRIQQERFFNEEEYLRLKGCYQLDEALLQKVEVQLYPSGQLGGDADLINSIALDSGTVDIIITDASNFATYDAKMGISALPFQFETFDDAWAFMDSDIEAAAEEGLLSQNMRVLAHYCNGFRCVTNSKGPINSPADMNGLLIRTPENPVIMATMTALGANPQPLSFSELYQALQQKTYDAQENPIPVIYNNNLFEVQEYLSITNHIYSGMCFTIAESSWNKLSADQQQIVSDAAKASADYDRELNEQQTNDLVSALEEKGMKINSPELAPFAAATEKVLTDNADTYGDLLDQLKAWKEAR